MEEKLKILKKCVCQDGEPIIPKGYSDEEVMENLYTLFNQNPISETFFDDLYEDYIKRVDISKSNSEITKEIKGEIYKKLGWDKLKPFTIVLDYVGWAFETKHIASEAHKKNGAIGLVDFFGKGFNTDNLNIEYKISVCIANIFSQINLKRDKLKSKSEKIEPSKFNSLKEIDKYFDVSKEIKKFYKDSNRLFEEREQVFNKYGETSGSIHSPIDKDLSKIFDIYCESDYIDRHQTVGCDYVINSWIENLQYDRCRIDYSENQYHPTISKTKRNYKPSGAAIKRLYQYYMNKVMFEEVASFEFDW